VPHDVRQDAEVQDEAGEEVISSRVTGYLLFIAVCAVAIVILLGVVMMHGAQAAEKPLPCLTTEIVLHDILGNAVVVNVELIEMRRAFSHVMGDPDGAATTIYFSSGNHAAVKESIAEINEIMGRRQ